MNSVELVDALKKKFGKSTDAELSKVLGITAQTLTNWRNSRTIKPTQIARLLVRVSNRGVSGQELTRRLIGKFASSESELAAHLGTTKAVVTRLKQLPVLSPQRIATLIEAASESARLAAERTSVRPLVEFYPLSKSRVGKGHVLFSTKAGGSEYSYLVGLRGELAAHRGVYIFFDSRGQAIYVGKARKQSLWKEMNLAFNRNRDNLQTIRVPKHPSGSARYRSLGENGRQIQARNVVLHELAYYVSAYQVSDGMVNDVEALLVRSFANNLLNKRIEKFSIHRPGRRSKK